MTQRAIFLIGLVFFAVILTGCQEESSDDVAIPTLIDLEARRTEQAPPPTTNPQPTETESSEPTTAPLSIRTLPPTFTPQPTQTPPPTFTPQPTSVANQFRGTLYYIQNDSQIVAQTGANTIEIRYDFAPGQINDLKFSPDNSLMAFVAPGNGSAREIFIAAPDGSYLQQVSCLGQANVQNPVWTSDGRTLVFLASQTVDTPLDIYAADWEGSNDCPASNNQRRIIDANITNFGDLIIDPSDTLVLYSDLQTFSVPLRGIPDVTQITSPSGFGSDFNMRFRPENPTGLAYLRIVRGAVDNIPPSDVTLIDVDPEGSSASSLRVIGSNIQSFQWIGPSTILAADNETIFTTGISSGRPQVLVESITRIAPPLASADGTSVLYVESVDAQSGLAQASVIDAEGDTLPTVAFPLSSNISDLHWITD